MVNFHSFVICVLCLASLLGVRGNAALGATAPDGDPCHCGATLYSVFQAAPGELCATALYLTNYQIGNAECSPTPACAPDGSHCVVTADYVMAQIGGIATPIDNNLLMRARCDAGTFQWYRCPDNPDNVLIGFNLECGPDCEEL